MPELPEVQTVVDDLAAHGLTGATFAGVRVLWPRSVSGCSPAGFAQRLAGQRIRAVERRAKFIVLRLACGDVLLIHLRMTGRLLLVGAGEDPSPYDRVRWALDDRRELVLRDTRKFARARLCGEGDEALRRLGPEPLDPSFTAAGLRARVAGRRRMIKPLLLDQTVLAGIGNIYADEALFEARIHPCRVASSLTERETRALWSAIRAVLRRGIRNLGTTLGSASTNFRSVGGREGRNRSRLRVFRRHGQPCPRCGATVVRLRVGQRGTHVCPRCQAAPRGADRRTSGN